MNKVRFLDEPKEENKPIEFTHWSSKNNGWTKARIKPSDFEEIIYLGRCKYDGDMFCAKGESGTIDIFKGHLNDGVY